MWVGMNTYFLVLLTIIFLRWARREERKDRDAMSGRTTAAAAGPPGCPGGRFTTRDGDRVVNTTPARCQ
jgi:hypothetical protein